MQTLINKLSKIKFTNYSNDTLTSEDGWSVSYSIKLQEIAVGDSLFQVVVRICYNDAYVSSYGCVTTDETNEFGRWFIMAKTNAYEMEYSNREKQGKMGKVLFESL